MDKPTKVIINCETGEQEVIELTDAEIAELEAQRIAFEEQQAQAQAEAEAIQAIKEAAHAKLAALGLTPEEISALSK